MYQDHDPPPAAPRRTPRPQTPRDTLQVVVVFTRSQKEPTARLTGRLIPGATVRGRWRDIHLGDSPNRAARSLGLRVGSRPLGLGHVGGRPAGSEYLGQHVPRVTPGTRARTQAIQASPPALGLHGVGHVGGWPVASPCPARTQGFPWNERVGLQLAGVTPSPGPTRLVLCVAR